MRKSLRWFCFPLGLSYFLAEFYREQRRTQFIHSYLGFNREEQELLNKMNFQAFDTRRIDRDIVEQVSASIKQRFQEEGHGNIFGMVIPRSWTLVMGTLAFPFVVCLTPLHALSYPMNALTNYLVVSSNNGKFSKDDNLNSDNNMNTPNMTFGEHVINYLKLMEQLYSEISGLPQWFCERVVDHWKTSSKEWKERENYMYLKLAITNGMDIFTQEELNSINTLLGDVEVYDNFQKYCTRYESFSSTFHTRRRSVVTFGHEYKWWDSLSLAKSALLWYCNNDYEKMNNYSEDERQREKKKRIQFALESLEKAHMLMKDLIGDSQKHNENISELERMDTLLEQNIEIVKTHLGIVQQKHSS
ncbi:hypothetical protein FDP41_000909 [Naegleria fowleri]|uniref:Letm1 RBD domain-containing protein n=1 Tax=Naegleria fowleri TaxID=5763 RepID=A0A6A5BWQ5_NAEFO|nr:uncharacterized protein FDP41_000909 [Naegleria fowleri]KAF0979756.1 hypothetical protein FDP41_000909 [Naegleria fowleri]CAG4715759.1 unnamed protein product [Naegleria fowleri]